MSALARNLLSCAAAFVAALTLTTAPARAEEPLDAQRRVNAEHAFLDGRLQDLPVILDGAEAALDRYPLVLAVRRWRVTPGVEVAVAGAELDARRLAWASAPAGEAPYPLPAAGEEEPYPLIDALVRDRIRRETLGAAGLPEDGPLARYAAAHDGGRTPEEAWVLTYAMDMQRRCYVGYEDPLQTDAADQAADRLRLQARLFYLATLGATIVLSFFGALVVGRRRDEPTRPA